MITLQRMFDLRRFDARYSGAGRCVGHEWDDAPVDRTKRLRPGDVQCKLCHVIVPILAAFFYEQGRRHGEQQRS